jgi:hypothetical protein
MFGNIMNLRTILAFLLGGFCGFVGWMILMAGFSCGRAQLPLVAGQEVPEENFVLDFRKPYHIRVSEYGGGSYTVDGRIVGFTGKTVQSASGPKRSYDYFERWLAVELSDGRRAFIPPNSIRMIEEAKDAKN